MEESSAPKAPETLTSTSDNQTTVSTNIPIKKKARAFTEIDDDDEDPPVVASAQATSPSAALSPPSTRELEARARKELVQFLITKHIDPKSADMYEIHIRMQKPRKITQADREKGRRSEGPGFSVTYSSPDGSILTTRSDVLNSIQELKKRKELSSSRSAQRLSSSSANNLASIGSPSARASVSASGGGAEGHQLPSTPFHQRISTSNGGMFGAPLSAKRTDAYVEAQAEINKIALPVEIDGMTVLNWGKIDHRTGFSSLVQLYPVGFKCEQVISITSITKGTVEQRVVCEIGDLDGFPEFRVTAKASGVTVLASSESAAWKKFNPSNTDSHWDPSFFNLSVELLLEGLSAAVECDAYKYHCERGYGRSYFDQQEALTAKVAYLAKSGREKRNLERQRARHLTKEELDRQQQIEDKRVADEKELAKKLAIAEKERKEFEREELKRVKQESRLQDQKRREEEKVEEAKRKEAQKHQEKAKREVSKKNDKHRQQYKKDINAELRRNRTEAAALVLSYFDEEEDVAEQREHTASVHAASMAAAVDSSKRKASSHSKENLVALDSDGVSSNNASSGGEEAKEAPSAIQIFLERELVPSVSSSRFDEEEEDRSAATSSAELLTCSKEQLGGRSDRNNSALDLNMLPIQTSWDEIFQLTNTLHLYKHFLKLEQPVTLDGVIDMLKVLSRAVPTTTAAAAAAAGDGSSEVVTVGEEHSPTAMDTEPTSTSVAAIANGTATAPAPAAKTKPLSLDVATAAVDRIQLRLVRHLLRELKSDLAVDGDAYAEDGSEPPSMATHHSAAKHHRAAFANVAAALRLPVNQLTWPELARMLLLAYLCMEVGYDQETTQHMLRGSKMPHFKLAKNVVRTIRYRMAVRAAASSFSSSIGSSAHSGGGGTTAAGASQQCALSEVRFLGKPVIGEHQTASDRLLLMPSLLQRKHNSNSTADASTADAAGGGVTVRDEEENDVEDEDEDEDDIIPFASEREIVQALEGIVKSCSTVEGRVGVVGEGGSVDAEEAHAIAGDTTDRTTAASPRPQPAQAYARCAKVLIKIVSLPQARNLLWEVDANAYPDYYEAIKRPIMYARIASKLVHRAYTPKKQPHHHHHQHREYEEKCIAQGFSRDMFLVVSNCITYNSEVTPVVGQAQRLLFATYRHIERWLHPYITTLEYPSVTSTSFPSTSAATPKIDICEDKYCLLTHTFIDTAPPSDAIKCGKCSGNFSLSALSTLVEDPAATASESTKKIGANYRDFYVAPTQELLEQQNEEWVCPLCLAEDSDSLLLDPRTRALKADAVRCLQEHGPFYIDEWGFTQTIPWWLNSDFSTVPAGFYEHYPYLVPILNALRVLSNPNASSVTTVVPNVDPSISSPTPPPATTDVRNWTLSERLTVLTALATVFRSSDKSLEYASQLSADCDRLLKLSAKPNFREGDFITAVKDLCGEEGVVLCRALLDGGNSSAAGASGAGGGGVSNGGEGGEEYLQTMITEGRCVICNGSTFEEDMQMQREKELRELDRNRSRRMAAAADAENQADAGAAAPEVLEDQVLLCDGCNAEVHMKCLHLTEVPNTAWHCAACTARLARRDSQLDHQFDNLDKHRDRSAEEQLVNTCVDFKIEHTPSNSRGASASSAGAGGGKDAATASFLSTISLSNQSSNNGSGSGNGSSGSNCVYCGMSEYELCSPFVVGQSRIEHDTCVAVSSQRPVANGFKWRNSGAAQDSKDSNSAVGPKTGTTVTFYNQGQAMPLPSMQVPFLPTVHSVKGQKLIQALPKGRKPIVAHQICALQIFQARVARSRHTLRRRNKIVGQRAVAMVGLSVMPLGCDDMGYEYWTFPSAPQDLFICTQHLPDAEKEEFCEQIAKEARRAKVAAKSEKLAQKSIKLEQKQKKAKRLEKMVKEEEEEKKSVAEAKDEKEDDDEEEEEEGARPGAETNAMDVSADDDYAAIHSGTGEDEEDDVAGGNGELDTSGVSSNAAASTTGSAGDHDVSMEIEDDDDDEEEEEEEEEEEDDDGVNGGESTDVGGIIAQMYPKAASSLHATAKAAAGTGANGLPSRCWHRITRLEDIQRVVELLGTSDAEHALRRNIINTLLLERTKRNNEKKNNNNNNNSNTDNTRPTAAAASASANASANANTSASTGDNSSSSAASSSSSSSSSSSDTAAAATGATTGSLTNWLTKSSSSSAAAADGAAADGGGDIGASVGAGEEPATTTTVAVTTGYTKKPAVDIVPVALRLQPNKGQEIDSTYVIDQEGVFDESLPTAGDDPQDNLITTAGASGAGGEAEQEVAIEMHSEYFSFAKGRKYFAVSLVNKEGQVVKMGGTARVQGLSVIYQIHREGVASPLTYAPLSDAWNDHMYYFSAVVFKRSGRYTISFIAEGTNAGAIKPLIFPVTVVARTVRCGVPDALDRLFCAQFRDTHSRQVVLGRKETVRFLTEKEQEQEARALSIAASTATTASATTATTLVDKNSDAHIAVQEEPSAPTGSVGGGGGGGGGGDAAMGGVAEEQSVTAQATTTTTTPTDLKATVQAELAYSTCSELEAVRTVLLSIFLALPQGSLVQEFKADAAAVADGQYLRLIAEPAGWNDLLEDAWRKSVCTATNPTQLMECTLLLEHYVNKSWLAAPQSRLLQVLPNPHFAMCCATYSSVALRLYCLDKCLLYDKVVVPPRDKRGGSYSSSSSSASAGGGSSHFDAFAYQGDSGGRTKRTAAAQASARIKSVSAEERKDEDGNSRQQRASAGSSSSSSGHRRARGAGADDDDDEFAAVEAEASAASSVQPQPWRCTACTQENPARARSCDACGERKPSADQQWLQRQQLQEQQQQKPRNKRNSRGRLKHSQEEEDDEEGDDDDEDDDDDDDDEEEEEIDEEGRQAVGHDEGARKSSRARNQVASYFVDSENEEDTGAEGGKNHPSKRVRTSGSQRPTSSAESDYYAQYSRRLPGLVRAFDEDIDRLLTTTTTTTTTTTSIISKDAASTTTTTGSEADATEQQLPKKKMDLQLRCLSVLRAVLRDERSEPFWEPVDNALVPSYRMFIKNPMDLGTIRNRLKSGFYTNKTPPAAIAGEEAAAAAAENGLPPNQNEEIALKFWLDCFAEDLRLVWSNCLAFNAPESVLATYAVLLRNKCEKILQDWILATNRPAHPVIREEGSTATAGNDDEEEEMVL